MSGLSDDSVMASLQAVAGVTYNHGEYNRDIIDTYLLRKARQKGIRLPTGGPPKEYKYLGAKVFQSSAGVSHNVTYIDVDSMYPSLLMTLNASPETLIGTKDELEASKYTEDDCVWGYIDPRPVKHIKKGEPWQQYTNGEYKMVYDPHAPSVKWTCDEDGSPQYEKLYFLSHEVQKGFLTECVEELIDLKNQYRGTSLYGSTKRVTNSIYGVLGFANSESSFRLFDWRIAEAITLCGRKMITHSANYVLDRLADVGHNDAHVALGDTDGCGIALPSAATRHDALSTVEDFAESLNGDGYDTFFQQEMGVAPEHHHGGMEVESFAPKVFIPARNPPHGDIGVKKRRIEWQSWDEDDGEISSISITGLEAERSDIAPITRTAQQAFAATLRDDRGTAREKIYPTLREWARAIQAGDMELRRVCKRNGIGQNLNEYGTTVRRPSPIYRGAKYANKHIDGITIQHGDKPISVHIEKITGDHPRTYTATTAEDGDVVDTIALPDASMLPDGFVVDWEKHLQKSLIDPMKPLLDTRFGVDSWSEILYQHRQSGLSAFGSTN